MGAFISSPAQRDNERKVHITSMSEAETSESRDGALRPLKSLARMLNNNFGDDFPLSIEFQKKVLEGCESAESDGEFEKFCDDRIKAFVKATKNRIERELEALEDIEKARAKPAKKAEAA